MSVPSPPVNEEIEQPASKEPALSAEEAEVARLLAAAEADLKARRLTSPVGNNAWEKYQEVLKLDSGNPEAVARMERVIESYMEFFGAAVEQEEFDKASGYLTRIRELHPDSPVLEAGERRLEALRAELERQRAEAIQEHWSAFDSAIQAEDLDEAARILARARDLNPEEPGLAVGKERLAASQAELERKRQAALMRELVGDMVSIPGGTFRMGDLNGGGDDDEKPVHSVTVSAFMLGKYEVTVGQFRRFVEATEYRTDAERNAGGKDGCRIYTGDGWSWTWGRSWRSPGYAIDDKQPVVCVSWNDAQAFIAWLTEQTGESYRLPTEAEWEYAARAGSTTKYHFGNSEAQLCRYANHADTSTDFDWRNKACSDGVGKRSGAVGHYQPNSYGLYDMHGNVYEQVQDCHNDSYAGAPTDGRAWELGDCSWRAFRGGSWGNSQGNLRSAKRSWGSREFGRSDIGFRLVQDK